MIWKEGDVVCRNKMLQPAYIVQSINNTYYVLKAITLTEYTLLLEKEIGGEILHKPIPLSFPEVIYMRKEYNRKIITARMWDRIPKNKVYEYLTNHPLRDDDTMNKYKSDIPKPKHIRIGDKNTDAINAPTIKLKGGLEMYLPHLDRKLHQKTAKKKLSQFRQRK